MKVILKRGPKGNCIWVEESVARARQRAFALAEIHNVRHQENSDTITVDATEYYGRKQ